LVAFFDTESARDEFVERPARVGGDFLSVRNFTWRVVEFFVFVFIHAGTRRVVVSGVTAKPDAAWVVQQARNATVEMAELGLSARVPSDGLTE
jgi:hypothetical protein